MAQRRYLESCRRIPIWQIGVSRSSAVAQNRDSVTGALLHRLFLDNDIIFYF